MLAARLGLTTNLFHQSIKAAAMKGTLPPASFRLPPPAALAAPSCNLPELQTADLHGRLSALAAVALEFSGISRSTHARTRRTR